MLEGLRGLPESQALPLLPALEVLIRHALTLIAPRREDGAGPVIWRSRQDDSSITEACTNKPHPAQVQFALTFIQTALHGVEG